MDRLIELHIHSRIANMPSRQQKEAVKGTVPLYDVCPNYSQGRALTKKLF
jgi:hypothetical protein